MSNDETLARPIPLKGEEDLGAPRLEAPLPIPGFQFESRIGQGAMGVVYKGYDTGFNPPEPVAIKLMDIRWSANAEFRGRFEREAKITVGFRNDHIVRVRTTGDL